MRPSRRLVFEEVFVDVLSKGPTCTLLILSYTGSPSNPVSSSMADSLHNWLAWGMSPLGACGQHVIYQMTRARW